LFLDNEKKISVTVFFISLIFLSIGSFSSVLIHRLPLMESNKKINLFTPRSHCVFCKKTIPFYFLIPIFGFMLQKGKCKFCNNKISSFYLINELIHLLIGLALYFYFGLSLIFLFSYLIFFCFYILFILDFKFFYLPFNINILLLILGLTSNGIFNTFEEVFIELQFISHSYFYGAVLGYLSLWIINFCFKKIKGKDGIGGGDFVLFAGIGSISGILSLAPILLIGTISSLFLYVSKPKMFSKQMPLGSCLIFGFLTYTFFNITELF